MKKLLISLTVLTTLLLAHSAFASQWYGTSLPLEDSLEANFSYPDNATINQWNIGLITVLELSGNPDAPWDFAWNAFCIDIGNQLGSGYADVLDLGSYTNLTASNALSKAAWLFENKWSPGNTVAMNAGLQLAIWDAIYNEVSPALEDVDNPVFEVIGDTIGTDEYNAYLSYITALGDNLYDGNQYRILEFVGQYGDRQDLLIKVVPEPATILLFGLGLLGISAAGRKKS